MKRLIICVMLAGAAILAAACEAGSPLAPDEVPATAISSTLPVPQPTDTPLPTAGQSPRPQPDAAGCTRVVAPDGDDSAAGTANAPWRTFQHAADMAAPGDVICFRGGVYAGEETFIAVSGQETQPILFVAYPGEQPILDGQGQVGGILTLQPGASYLGIDGFVMTGYTVWGVSLEGDNHTITLRHLDVGGGEAGIHFTVGESGQDPWYGPVEHITVEDSVIHNVTYTAVDCTPGPCNDMRFSGLEIYGAGLSGGSSFAADGLAVERGQPIRVEDCVIHDNGGDGIDLNSRDWDGGVTDVVVWRNQVYRNHLQAIKLWAGGRMENNVVWGQGINPVTVGVYPGEYVVAHNTIAYNLWDPAFSARDYSFVAAYPEVGESAPIRLQLVNNIFAYNGSAEVGGPTGIYLGAGVTLVDSGGNLFFSREDGEIQADFVTERDPWFTQADIAGGAWAAVSGSLGDFVADPLFVAGWPEVDLHLRSGSPAIDAALADFAPSGDLEGNPRVEPPDVGAYEFRP